MWNICLADEDGNGVCDVDEVLITIELDNVFLGGDNGYASLAELEGYASFGVCSF